MSQWPETQEDRLRVLWDGGQSAAEIAQTLTREGWPVTRNAVIGKAHRIGLAMRRSKQQVTRKPPREKPGRKIRLKKLPKMRPLVPRKVAPPPAEPLMPPACEPVTMMQLGSHHCRYIIGPTNGPATLFCGASRDGTAWCPYHHQIVLSPPQPRERRVRDEKLAEAA